MALRIVLAAALLGSMLIGACECRKRDASPAPAPGIGSPYAATSCRAYSASITDFGGVGDGVKLNTKAFQAAVEKLSSYGARGGGLLFVPAGRWLTGSFDLTSHFTLFLHKDAVLLASADVAGWPLISALPSYGQGRDTKADQRYKSFIFGSNLTDVVITGHNGTIDGQGAVWWSKWKKLKFSRPYLIELLYTHNILISNLTLLNAPTWNVHPVYSSNITVQGITILAPVRSPNTDGINPDSCTDVWIVDCYVVSGDDCVAVKSGWDQYGIAVGLPTRRLWIQRLTCVSPTSAVVALGSEMSGGIGDLWAEDVVAVGTESAIRIKTAPGRGGYVENVHVRRFRLHTMKMVFWITSDYKSHPDGGYNPKALPRVRNINYRDVVAENATMAGRLEGIPGDEFTGLCLANVTIGMAAKARKQPWTCSAVQGVSSGVTPQPCPLLADKGPAYMKACDFPEKYPPINTLELRQCSVEWMAS